MSSWVSSWISLFAMLPGSVTRVTWINKTRILENIAVIKVCWLLFQRTLDHLSYELHTRSLNRQSIKSTLRIMLRWLVVLVNSLRRRFIWFVWLNLNILLNKTFIIKLSSFIIWIYVEHALFIIATACIFFRFIVYHIILCHNHLWNRRLGYAFTLHINFSVIALWH